MRIDYQKITDQTPKRNTMTKKTRLLVAERSDWHCVYCGIEICQFGTAAEDGQIDHFKAFARGGLDDLENYVLACRSCNTLKNGNSLERLRRRLALKKLDFPGSCSTELMDWIEKTFGPFEYIRFWYEANPLKPAPYRGERDIMYIGKRAIARAITPPKSWLSSCSA